MLLRDDAREDLPVAVVLRGDGSVWDGSIRDGTTRDEGSKGQRSCGAPRAVHP